MSKPINDPVNKPNTTLSSGSPVNISDLALQHRAVAPEQDGGDSPTTGSAGMGNIGGVAVGVWEMSTGTMYDVEVEEIFIVTAGRGTVLIQASRGSSECVPLFPGVLMRLSAEMKTIWTVAETLRKVYITPCEEN